MERIILTGEKDGKRKILYVEVEDNFILEEETLQEEVYKSLNEQGKINVEYEAETEHINEIEQFLKKSVYKNHDILEYKGVPYLISYDNEWREKSIMDLKSKKYYVCPERTMNTYIFLQHIDDKTYFIEYDGSNDYAICDAETGKSFDKNNYDGILIKNFTGEPRIYRVLICCYVVGLNDGLHYETKVYYEDVETRQVYEKSRKDEIVKKSIGIVIKEFLDSKPQPFYMLKDGDKIIYKSVNDTVYGKDRYFTEDGEEYDPKI